MGYVEKISIKTIHAWSCTCYKVPSDGKFTIDKTYSYIYIIDGEIVVDDLGEEIIFEESVFKLCFGNCEEAVTSFSPIQKDKTTYHVYMVLVGETYSLEEIKAYAKLKNINYLQARTQLTQKRNLIASGDAYETAKVLDKLEELSVQYEVEPTYPY